MNNTDNFKSAKIESIDSDRLTDLVNEFLDDMNPEVVKITWGIADDLHLICDIQYTDVKDIIVFETIKTKIIKANGLTELGKALIDFVKDKDDAIDSLTLIQRTAVSGSSPLYYCITYRD